MKKNQKEYISIEEKNIFIEIVVPCFYLSNCCRFRIRNFQDPTIQNVQIRFLRPQKIRPGKSGRQGLKPKNTENKELKGRMYVTLLCSIVGMAIMTFVSMFLGVLIYISMHQLS